MVGVIHTDLGKGAGRKRRGGGLGKSKEYALLLSAGYYLTLSSSSDPLTMGGPKIMYIQT